MKLSTISGLAAGSMLGVAVGASLMMMPQGRKMKRALGKSGAIMKKQMNELLSGK